MKLKLIQIAAACILALSSMQASAGQVEEHSTRPIEGPAAKLDDVNKSGKTTVVFVIDQNDCSTPCGRMIQQLIYATADYPNVKIETGTPEEWGIAKELLPYALVVVPQCGIVKRLPNYTATTPEAIAYLMKNLENGAAMQPVTRTCK